MLKNCVVDSSHGRPGLLFQKNDTDIYMCGTCGCIMADVGYYKEQYESPDYYAMAYKAKAEIDNYWGLRCRLLLRRIISVTGKPEKLLDVGAGNGYFVYVAKNEFGIDATGLEISEEEVRFARRTLGVDLLHETLSEHTQSDYSVITLFNVIGHVPDPMLLLNAAHEHLDSGGYFAVTTSNPSALSVKLQGLRRWKMISPPHIINIFTKDNMFTLLAKAGFAPVYYETPQMAFEVLRKYDRKNRLKIVKLVAYHVLRVLNLGTDHLVIARKKLNSIYGRLI